jgi:uncharacterized protein YfaS (alpha-2-macroglobulin family)
MRGALACLALAALAAPGAARGADPHVELFSPQGSAKDVRQVRVRFSAPMVAVGDPRLPDPFEIECSEPGSGRWADARNWVYDFERDLPAGVACRFALHAGVAAQDGAPLGGEREFHFDTGGPAIRASNPYDGHPAIDESQVFVLALDGPADAATVAAHARCAVAGLGEAIEVDVLAGEERAAVLAERRQLGYAYLQILWKGGFETIERVTDDALARAEAELVLLRCRRTLPGSAEVKLVWGAGIRSPSGIATAREQVLAFRTRPEFAARFECRRVRADAGCLPLGPMALRFSAPVSRELAARVRMVGAGGTAWPADPGAAPVSEAVEFAGPFPESTRFRVEVPVELRDDAGRALSNASRFPLEVATDELPPLAKFSGEFGILESREGGVLPVTLRNLEPEVAAKLQRVGSAADAATGIPGLSLRLADDDAEIARWIRRVETAMRYRSERVRAAEGQDEASEARSEPQASEGHWVWKERTGSTSVFEDAPPGSGETRSFTVPKPGGAREFEVVGIPLGDPGLYVVELASPRLGAALLESDGPRYVATAALVTNLAVHLEWGRESSLVWVTTLDAGEPVAGAEVRIGDWCTGGRLWDGRTDADGIARVGGGVLPAPHAGRWCGPGANPPLFASARTADDLGFAASFWSRGIEPSEFGHATASWTGPFVAHSVLDRSLFRAGETVSMKHYLRKQTLAGLAIPPELPRAAKLELVHEGSGQEQSVDLAFDASGIAESAWPIPRDAKLGTYRLAIEAELDGEKRTLASGELRVEQFRVPTMKAVVQPPAEPLVNAREASVDLFVGYLGGGGAGGAPVVLRTLVRPRRVAFPGYGDFRFGGEDVVPGIAEEGGFDLDAFRRRRSGAPGRPAQVLPLGLDAAGAARARIPDLPAVAAPHEVVAELEYQDANGELLSVASRIPLWPAKLQLGIRTEGWVASEEQARFRVVALDLRGEPVAGVPVAVDLFQRTTLSHRRRLVGGFYAYESRVETKPLEARCAGRTDANGLLACEVAPGVSGRIALRARATDELGNAAIASDELWLAGADDWWFGGGPADRMDVLPEKTSYEPGEVARFQVRMPFRSATALVSVEREGVAEAFVTRIGGTRPVVEVPIAGHHAPNVYVSVLAVRGRVGGLRSRLADLARAAGFAADGGLPTARIDLSRPSWRLGLAAIDVGWAPHRLEVSVHPDAETYRTRETARVRVAVRRAGGGALPGGGEVAIAAVDEGLLELLPNDSWNLLEPMMRRRGIEVFTSTAQMQVVGKRHYGRKAVPHGGGGGRASARELFDTLLLWRGRVPLDARGEARVEVPLNDSLTSFRIAAVASAGAELFGTGAATIRTAQELVIHPGLPSLVREGDRFSAVFTLRNASDAPLAVLASARATPDRGAARELAAQRVELAPGAAQPVAWELVAPAGAARIDWEVEARAGEGPADRLRASQSVAPVHPVRVVQATLARVAGAESLPVARPADALPDRGGVEVGLRARLGDGLDAVREYMAKYPYTCLEQKVSQAVALRDPLLWDEVMRELPAYLDADGLLRYFASDWLPGEDALTAYVLAVAAEAGWPIPAPQAERLRKGLRDFVEGRVVRDSALPTADLTLRKLAAIEALARHGEARPEWLGALSIDPKLWPTSALLDWLGILARVEAVPDGDARRAEAEAQLRARMDFQGTRLGFSAEHRDALWWLMLSADTNAVRAVLALLEAPAWREDLPRIARGALGRQLSGRWNTTTANAWGVLAFEKFSAAFEATPVEGRTEVALAGAAKGFDWESGSPGGALDFAWPRGPATLAIRHAGAGRPWAFVTARAAVPLAAPFSSGYRIRRTLSPVEQRTPGRWSRGDVARVSLEIDAASDMTWVVVDDPVPAGARILGGGLGRDSELLSAGERRGGDAWPAYEERRFDAFRSYWRLVPKGTLAVEYTLRFDAAGRFLIPPTRVEALYAPEMHGELPNAPIEVAP